MSTLLDKYIKATGVTVPGALSATLLLDSSASMSEELDGTHSKWDELRSQIRQIDGERYSFSSQFVAGERYLGHSTDMGRAFGEMRSRGKTRFVLVTDGLPDSETDAIAQAKGLVIDIIYIGPEPRPDFLDRLARLCGGTAQSHQLGRPARSLATTIKALSARKP